MGIIVLVKMDQKWRIRIPKKVRKALKLQNKQPVEIEIEGSGARISSPSKERIIETDPVLRDMIERPLKSKIKITRELLEKLEEEQWSGL
ncbi:MAG: AbrB/MazE/SpoVT family DNA-binding domain-containing protein [Candidatus Micrarchaeota archaeon]|nr:AbrB/MazE/SpoVT family DNA-binding domain-containing protein [Candidatus Micrarchaeota archaeon]